MKRKPRLHLCGCLQSRGGFLGVGLVASHGGSDCAGEFLGNFSGSSLSLSALQEEKVDEAGQLEPPGFQMIHLPFFEDVRAVEKVTHSWLNLAAKNERCFLVAVQYHPWPSPAAPRASSEQVDAAITLMKRVDLKNFSMMDIQNPSEPS